MVVEQREREARAVAEAAVERARPDARGAGDVVHRDALDAALGDELGRGGQDALAVARGVRALGGACAGSASGSGSSSTTPIMPIARPARPPL